MANLHFIKVDPTTLTEGEFQQVHVSNRNVLNVERIKGISILSLSANFKSEKKYDKVVEIVTNYANNYVWTSDGKNRQRRPVPLCTLHLKQESGKKFIHWSNPLSQTWIPVSNPDEILKLWCKDVFTGDVVRDKIEISLIICLKICP